eukprot:GHVN01095425.1.p1 GENE.GHVN01095425.1~~GHVN01095425.1.p1  ORF type:complete len:170 (+),score=32.86 GHVN01095425.1:174-683(+)
MGPIVVLSYKNHAIDELLIDLLEAGEGEVNQQGGLVRMGSRSSNDRLNEYTEYELFQPVRYVGEAKDVVRMSIKDLDSVVNHIKQASQFGERRKWLMSIMGVHEDGARYIYDDPTVTIEMEKMCSQIKDGLRKWNELRKEDNDDTHHHQSFRDSGKKRIASLIVGLTKD